MALVVVGILMTAITPCDYSFGCNTKKLRVELATLPPKPTLMASDPGDRSNKPQFR